MLNLAGIDLITDNTDGDFEDFIRKHINTNSFMPWLRDSWPGYGLSAVSYPNGYRPEPTFKLGRFHWPTGASRWGYGHFLAASSQVETLAETAYGDKGEFNLLPFKMGSKTNQADGSSIGESFSTEVYLLQPVPLSGIRSPDNGDSLYLITLVDRRYFWWWENWGDFSITPESKWEDLYGNIVDILDIDFTWDDIPTEYLQPSTMFQLPFEPLPRIFDAICFNLNQRLVAKFDGTFVAQNYDTALKAMNEDMANSQNRFILAGGQSFPAIY